MSRFTALGLAYSPLQTRRWIAAWALGQLARGVRRHCSPWLITALFMGMPGAAVAAKSSRSAADALSQASEIAEQLSESASTIDASAFRKSMSKIDRLDARLTGVVPPDRKAALDGLLAGIRNAWAAGDRNMVALQSIEAYRLLQEAVARGARSVPVQVSQLDYAGFKVNALLSSRSTDWNQIGATLREAQGWWAAIEPKVTDATLKEAMNRTLLGMHQAADQKDAKVMHFAADMDLILVDGLETFFIARPRSR